MRDTALYATHVLYALHERHVYVYVTYRAICDIAICAPYVVYALYVYMTNLRHSHMCALRRVCPVCLHDKSTVCTIGVTHTYCVPCMCHIYNVCPICATTYVLSQRIRSAFYVDMQDFSAIYKFLLLMYMFLSWRYRASVQIYLSLLQMCWSFLRIVVLLCGYTRAHTHTTGHTHTHEHNHAHTHTQTQT